MVWSTSETVNDMPVYKSSSTAAIPATDISVDASAFDNNLDTTVTDAQKLAAAVDDLVSGASPATVDSIATLVAEATPPNIYGIDNGSDDPDNGIYVKFAQGDVRKVSNTTVLYGEGSNLLINSNGLDPIDQREKLGTAFAAGAYTIDRWAVGAACTVTNTGSGVRFAFTNTLAAATSWGPLQRMEYPESYSNKTLTLSGKIRASGGDVAYAGLYSNGTKLAQLEIASDGEWYEFSLTCNLGTISTNLYPVIGLYNAVAGDYVEFQWMKLEFGSVATDFVPPDKAAETSRCQRFYYAVRASTVGAGFCYSTTSGLVSIPFLCEMRAAPSFSFTGSVFYTFSYQGGIIATTNLVAYNSTKCAMVITVTVASGLVAGCGTMLYLSGTACLSFSAEI